jgi:hypothetical protein
MGAKESVCVENCSVEERRSRSFLVRQIVDKSMKDQLNALSVKHNIRNLDSSSEDSSRPLKSVATDFVVEEYFSTTNSLYQFLSTVHDVYETALAYYREQRGLGENECLFLFKGGNILRIVAHEFLKTMPEYAHFQISRYYEPFFKRSDNDFSILLDPNIDDYDAIFDEVTTMAYHLQDLLRTIFMNDLNKYFDFSRYKDQYKQQIYAKWLVKFNETGLGDFTGIKTSTKEDSTSRFVKDDYGNEERQVASAKINRQKWGSPFVIKHNNALEFPNPQGERVSFNLTRTKVVFSLQKKAGGELEVQGELIDVSIPHRTDTNIGYFFQNLEDNIAEYDLDMGPLSNPLHFTSLSLHYLIHDLEYILYKFNDLPWEDSKYSKRMNRLVYMYFIDMFIQTEQGSERLKIMLDVKSAITKGSRFKRQNILFANLLKEVSRLRASSEGTEEFDEMIALLEENCDFLIKSLEFVHVYCETDGKASREDIYTGSTSSLI